MNIGLIATALSQSTSISCSTNQILLSSIRSRAGGSGPINPTETTGLVDLNIELPGKMREITELTQEERRNKLDSLVRARDMRFELRAMEKEPIIAEVIKDLAAQGKVLPLCSRYRNTIRTEEPFDNPLTSGNHLDRYTLRTEQLFLGGKGFQISGTQRSTFYILNSPDFDFDYTLDREDALTGTEGIGDYLPSIFTKAGKALGLTEREVISVIPAKALAALIENGLYLEAIRNEIEQYRLSTSSANSK